MEFMFEDTHLGPLFFMGIIILIAIVGAIVGIGILIGRYWRKKKRGKYNEL